MQAAFIRAARIHGDSKLFIGRRDIKPAFRFSNPVNADDEDCYYAELVKRLYRRRRLSASAPRAALTIHSTCKRVCGSPGAAFVTDRVTSECFSFPKTKEMLFGNVPNICVLQTNKLGRLWDSGGGRLGILRSGYVTAHENNLLAGALVYKQVQRSEKVPWFHK